MILFASGPFLIEQTLLPVVENLRKRLLTNRRGGAMIVLLVLGHF